MSYKILRTTQGNMDTIRMTLATKAILTAFLENQDKELSGADVWRLTKIASGTRYPIMIRLEQRGVLMSRWEDVDPAAAGRPRLRFYKLTEAGASWAEKRVKEERGR
jgi:PadR family transcriptional regulator, regulatory protein PadR